MEFHEKLQELRKQKGLTQDQLAEKLYVSRTAVSKWESGRGYPNIESLKAISKYFGVHMMLYVITDWLGFCPDHGCHLGGPGLEDDEVGGHGLDIPKDREILHYFTALEGTL